MKESMSSPSSRWMPNWRRAAKVKLGSLPLFPGPRLPATTPSGENTESLVLVLRLLMEVLSSVSLAPVYHRMGMDRLVGCKAQFMNEMRKKYRAATQPKSYIMMF